MKIESIKLIGGSLRGLKLPVVAEVPETAPENPGVKTNKLFVAPVGKPPIAIRSVFIPPPKIPDGPEFWMYTNIPLAGTYPSFGDSASATVAEGSMNFGQRAFLGDPKGYLPYDSNYRSYRYRNGVYNYSRDSITPSNLNTAHYLLGKTSGKYYFEVTLRSPTVSAIVGMAEPGTGQMNYINRHFAALVGDNPYHRNSLRSRFIGNSLQSRITYGPIIKGGDTIQVWVDFDNGRISLKALGTTIDQYTGIISA